MPEWVRIDLQEVEKLTWNVGQVQQRIGEIPRPFLMACRTRTRRTHSTRTCSCRRSTAYSLLAGMSSTTSTHSTATGVSRFCTRAAGRAPLTSFDEYSERYS